jgi:hypothetical protein
MPSAATQPARRAETQLRSEDLEHDDTAATSSLYVTTSINLERRVLRKLKARRNAARSQYRSVSALANHLLAKALGLDL